MNAVELYNDAFNERITSPNAPVLRVMMDVAALRNRPDIATAIAAECATILNPPVPPAMGRREFREDAPLYPLFDNTKN